MKNRAIIQFVCYLAVIVLFIQKPAFATDPPLPPDTHNEETDKDMGGGAPLENDLLFYIGIAGIYLIIQGSKNRKLKFGD